MATALAKPTADGDTAATAKKGGKKLLIIAAVVALLAGGGGGAYFTGALDGLLGGDEADSAGVDAEADSEGGHGAEPGAGGDSTAKAGGHIAEAGASQGDSAAAVDAHGGGGGGDAAEGEFFELPEFIVNMNTPGERRRFLRLRARLDVADPQARGRIEAMLPRIVDAFQVFLRELRPADIAGSAGTFRLREELLRRVNSEIAPAKADDLLFVELVVQ